MKLTIHKSIDPSWPKWAVIGAGSQTKWFDTEEQARLAVATPELFAALVDLVHYQLGSRYSPQGIDQWKIWADQYRSDANCNTSLVRAVDALLKAK